MFTTNDLQAVEANATGLDPEAVHGMSSLQRFVLRRRLVAMFELGLIAIVASGIGIIIVGCLLNSSALLYGQRRSIDRTDSNFQVLAQTGNAVIAVGAVINTSGVVMSAQRTVPEVTMIAATVGMLAGTYAIAKEELEPRIQAQLEA